MGAKVAPSKNYNFASSKKASVCLGWTWWEHIKAKIEVVKDFLGISGHISPRKMPTQEAKILPATVEAKAKAILAKLCAAAFYGIDAAEVPVARIATLIAAFTDEFRFRNDNHNVG